MRKFLPLVFCLLTLPFVFAISMEEDLCSRLVLQANFDGDLTDTSAYGNTGTNEGLAVVDTTVSKYGIGSAKFQGKGNITFWNLSNGAYSYNNKNLTYMFWSRRPVISAASSFLIVRGPESSGPNGRHAVTSIPDGTYDFYIRGDSIETHCYSTNAGNGTHFNLISAILNRTDATAYTASIYINQTPSANCSYTTSAYTGIADRIMLGEDWDSSANATNISMDGLVVFNKSLNSEEISFYYNLGRQLSCASNTSSSASIVSYNLTSDGGNGCTTWTANPNGTCTTADTTPTIVITSNVGVSCRISKLNQNYSSMSSIGECDGSGNTTLGCTLPGAYEILTENSQVFIGCRTYNGLENQNSTSGTLRISIHTNDLETIGGLAIESAALHVFGSGYTIYSSQRVYVRNAANQQATGMFDRVIKWTNKIWAFNIIHGNDTSPGLFNITPVFYTLEFRNATSYAVNETVKQLLNATK